MASLVSYALCTLADVKETLGIASSDNSWDNIIIRKINQATEIIEGWTGRRFAQTTYTSELYDASADNQLILKNRPVSAVSLGARDTTMNSGSFDTIPTDQYFVDSTAGIIDAVSSFWGSYDQWSVTYTAGYATIPADLAEACATLAAYMTSNDPSTQTGISSKREGSRQVTYFDHRSSTNDSLFTQLGIIPTLERYSVPALGSGR